MRQCERCGSRMPPYIPRKTVGGQRVCEGCSAWSQRSAGFKNLAALNNPISEKTKKHPQEWFHGSPREFEEFGDPSGWHDADDEEASGRFKHWNILLGNHFTSDHGVASEFSSGEHSHPDDQDEDYEGPLGHVVHVKLHMKNPKVYGSEHDMDQEVYEHEWERGNTHDSHNPPPGEDADEDEREDWADYAGERRHYAHDSHHKYKPNDPDPNYAYGFHPKATGWLNTHPDKEGIARRYKDRLKRQGYDGILYGNEYEFSHHGKKAQSAIAFEPDQIEITQHHYGGEDCLTSEEAKRRTPPRGQLMLPGTEDYRRTLPKENRPDTSKHWPTTWTPSFFENRQRPLSLSEEIDNHQRGGPSQSHMGARISQSYDTGRLWAPLPKECWDRYYGRKTAMLGDPTDWDTYYEPSMQIHRGIHVKAPMSLLDKLSDPERTAEVAQDLVNRTSARKSTGMHWSSNLEKARDFGSQFKQGSDVPVILHGQVPAREHIETRPAVLKRNQVFDYHPTKGEQEVPLRKGAGVDVFGISWRPHQPHPSADEHGWVRHDFTAPIRHTASAQGPFFHGTASEFQPGDLVDPERELGGRRGGSYAYMTLDPEAAHNYGKYKAQARWVIGDDDASPRAYEVEPTGPVEPDDTVDERFQAWRTKYPLRVVREIKHGRTSAKQPHGEQSALNEMGQQDVYAVRSGDTMVNLCAYHRDVHVGNSRAADSLGAGLGIGARERSAETLGGARKGRCAACGKDTSYQLKLLTPRSMQSRHKEERQPSRRGEPYVPTRTKPLMPLKQSENTRWASKGDLFHADSGKVRFNEDGRGREGDHSIPAGAEVHDDETEAWNKAIEHWKNGRSDFPRVYVAHRPQTEIQGGTKVLSHPAEASELEYDHERHPAIRSDNEEPHEPIMYHGTTRYEEDDTPEEITAGGGSTSFGPGTSDSNYAYATPNLSNAWTYAEKRAENGHGGRPTVYRVTPHNPDDVEQDPQYHGDTHRGNYADDKRSKSGFEVLDEVPMSQKQEHEWRHSPFNDEAEDDYDEDGDWGESHYGVKLANEQMELFHAEPVHRDPEPEPEEDKPWCEECGEHHDEDEGHRECAACGERHEDYEEKDRHESTMTDWDDVYPTLNSHVHRVLPHMELPSHVHDVVYDESRPMEERGKALLDHIESNHGRYGLGMHWSDVFGEGRGHGADKFAGVGGGHPRETQVVLHARKPDLEDIETDPDTLDEHQVYGYHGHDENEVPIQRGAPVHITGVSWRPGGFHQEWRRHNLKEPMEMTASKKLPTLRMLAHDATENQAIRHCPFCGSGKIIGRQDGSVECEFCHGYFTVQVQPQYPNYPQTIGGVPQDVPGMPGQVEQPSGVGGGFPPGEEGDEEGNPFADGDQDEDDESGGGFPPGQGDEEEPGEDEDNEPPPFAKKSFRTATGARLPEDDYVRHLAISLAPDRPAMIERIRQERGA